MPSHQLSWSQAVQKVTELAAGPQIHSGEDQANTEETVVLKTNMAAIPHQRQHNKTEGGDANGDPTRVSIQIGPPDYRSFQ